MSAELCVITAEPLGDTVVSLLEDALERAKRGEISSAAFAMVDRDGCSEIGWSYAHSRVALVGSIQRLLHRYNLRIDEDI